MQYLKHLMYVMLYKDIDSKAISRNLGSSSKEGELLKPGVRH